MLVALAGGVGAAKFLRGLLRVHDPGDLLVVGNTGDDLRLHGLAVSPDLDSVAYTLAGLADEERGWGLAGETWNVRDALVRLGEPGCCGPGCWPRAPACRRPPPRSAGAWACRSAWCP
jgi:LPPG:FO 2-phospho-L-lactate transferase